MFKSTVLVLVTFAVMFTVGTAHASDITPASTYPGWNRTGTMWTNVALHQVQTGVTLFYQVYERWPSSWREVTSSGLWQTPLRGYDNSTVDPDDGQVNGFGDLYYNPQQDPPRIHFWHFAAGNGIETVILSKPQTLRNRLNELDAHYGDTSVSSSLGEERRLILYGVTEGIRRTLPIYRDLKGNYPMSFSELLQSGLFPIDRRSVNPLTGAAFTGNGAANDILYRYFSQSETPSGQPSYMVRPIEADGNPPEVIFTF